MLRHLRIGSALPKAILVKDARPIMKARDQALGTKHHSGCHSLMVIEPKFCLVSVPD
jgi:hypothetical protein